MDNPIEIARSISHQWPCRETQSRQLASLLSVSCLPGSNQVYPARKRSTANKGKKKPQTPSPSTVVVHGISATCKTTITNAVLGALRVPHAIVRSTECITGRHLLTKILWATLEALGRKSEWEAFGRGRCEHVSSLAVLLDGLLSGSSGTGTGDGNKFVLVLDGVDRQREAPGTLLPALARLGDMAKIPSLCVVLVLSSTPRPLFLQRAAVPHVHFPAYTRNEATTIMLNSEPPAVRGVSMDVCERIYPVFVSTLFETLVGPTASSIPVFRSMCDKLWPQFIAPVANGETPPGGSGSEWDFSRLLVRNRSLFRQQGEAALVHHIVPEEPTRVAGSITKPALAAVSAPSPLPSLPYFPILVLTSAYLASHIPQRLDTIFFSKFSSSSLSARNKRAHHRRRLKLLSRAQAEDDKQASSSATATATATTPRRGRGQGKRQKTRITKSTLENAFATSSATTSAGTEAGAPTAGGIAGPSTILTARPFPLERLLAIYHAIDPNPPANPTKVPPAADAIYAELATLRRLRLVVPAAARDTGGGGSGGLSSGNTSADAGDKWCVNVSGDWIGEVAKEVGVEVGEWLAGGLD